MAELEQLHAINDALDVQNKKYETRSRTLSKFRRQLRQLDKNSKHYAATQQALNKLVDKEEKLLGDVEKRRGALKQFHSEMNKATSVQTKTVAEYNEAIVKTSMVFKRQEQVLKRAGLRGKNLYSELKKEEKAYHDNVLKHASERVKTMQSLDSPDRGTRKEAQKKFSGEFLGSKGAGGIASGAKDILGIKSQTMGNMGSAFKTGKGATEKIGASFKNMFGQMKDAGGGIMSFSGAMKALGTAMKGLNWIGLLVGGLKAVVSLVNDLDKMIKGLNKSWQQMAGSPVLMRSVSGSMKEFNDSIYNVGRNMRLGLKASNIQDFFKAMSTAGLSLEGVSQKAGTYNAAIEKGFKLSKQFGVSFTDMGSMMTNQMMNLRSSLEDVGDAFKNMSYDAAVAGVQSQKFYQVVESASMSLSFYGNYLKSTSSMLRSFSETGLMGFKDASETVQTLMGTIKGMGMDQRRSLVSILGEDEVLKMMNDRVKKMDAAINKQTLQVDDLEKSAAGGEDVDANKQLKAAKDRLHAAKMDRMNLQESIRTGDITAMSGQLDVLSDEVLKSAAKVMNNLGVDFFENKAAAYAILQDKMGWGIDTVNKAMKRSNVVLTMMDDQFGTFAKTMSDNTKANKLKTLAQQVSTFFNDPQLSPFTSMEKMIQDVESELSGMELSSNEVNDAISLIKEGGTVFSKFVNEVGEASEKGAKGLSSKLMKALATTAGVVTPGSKGADLPNKRLEELVKQTTPLADYLEIGKENVKYALASSDLQSSIALAAAKTAMNTSGILKTVVSWFQSSNDAVKRKSAQFSDPTNRDRRRYQSLTMQKMSGPEMLAQMSSGGASKQAMEDVRKKLSLGETELKTIEERFSDIPWALEAARVEGMRAAEETVRNITGLSQAAKDIKSKKEDLDRMMTERGGESEAAKETISNAQRRVVWNFNNLVGTLNKALKNLDNTYGTSGDGKGIYESALGKEKMAEAGSRASTAADVTGIGTLGQKSDFITKKGGLVNLKRGDIAVDSASFAKGIGMGAGQMMNNGTGIMKGGGGGFSINGVTLNFNAPMDGKPEDYRRMFVDAVEDVVNRRMYEEKSRV